MPATPATRVMTSFTHTSPGTNIHTATGFTAYLHTTHAWRCDSKDAPQGVPIPGSCGTQARQGRPQGSSRPWLMATDGALGEAARQGLWRPAVPHDTTGAVHVYNGAFLAHGQPFTAHSHSPSQAAQTHPTFNTALASHVPWPLPRTHSYPGSTSVQPVAAAGTLSSLGVGGPSERAVLSTAKEGQGNSRETKAREGPQRVTVSTLWRAVASAHAHHLGGQQACTLSDLARMVSASPMCFPLPPALPLFMGSWVLPTPGIRSLGKQPSALGEHMCTAPGA